MELIKEPHLVVSENSEHKHIEKAECRCLHCDNYFCWNHFRQHSFFPLPLYIRLTDNKDIECNICYRRNTK